MLQSRLLIPTSKETPKDAVLKSHKLLVQAGYIYQSGSGVYSLLPLGKIVLDKVANVVRKYMNEAGAQEVLLSFVTPAELWRESGRYELYGKELLRFKDRKDNEFILAPTHEESITQLVKSYVKSYKALPLNLYQIQLKFRDELRPRFGLLRTREFLMKDAYSFHSSKECLLKEFENMHKAYSKIFSELGLEFRAVEADSGAIGGSGSKEFMVLADSGEDTLVVCTQCEYAANIEAAKRAKRAEPESAPRAQFARFPTPNVKTIDDVCKFFHIEPYYALKAVVKAYTLAKDSALGERVGFLAKNGDCGGEPAVITTLGNSLDSPCKAPFLAQKSCRADTALESAFENPAHAQPQKVDSSVVKKFAVFFLRGDDVLEETKALNALRANGYDALELLDASAQELESLGLIAGSIGAVGIRAIMGDSPILFDEDLRDGRDIICGGNERDTHIVGVDFTEFADMVYAPLAAVRDGDMCVCCKGALTHKKGIEVGHIFQLGDKYSSALKAEYLAQDSSSKPFIMGCYGIGISRLLPAILEQKADEKGCVWSKASAPYAVQVIIANTKNEQQSRYALELYQALLARGVAVLCDDRDLRFGAKMADFELVGAALYGIVVGKGLESGVIECIKRDGLEKQELSATEVQVVCEAIMERLER
ncbi:proline-tRNA ligase [Helicobacter canis NCTC 12740]|uniref:Proline--tRNA ligase n=1 Tax=Helicobacter canis NCTC 12740 TaxID=1357399 RepID=V8CFE1_9HELI|nr:proline-tRNA ligase [Helicobacter canis NCTC 12740]